MKRTLLILSCVLLSGAARAIDDNTVEIYYEGASATITVASNISSYVTVTSGTSSHVNIVQSESFAGVDATADNEDGEITYSLSGISSDGEFVLVGSYKCTVELNGVSLTNPGETPAINIKNGKRVAVSAKKDKVNTLTDAATDTLSGCLQCKGHLKMKGKGTLNIYANGKHGIYSKEYLEVKNLTLNIMSAPKDGLHCKNYFLMESGKVNISGAQDDGIQVEIEGTEPTVETVEHEDEDSGNFYQEGGTLTISGYEGKAVKADGSINFSGGTQAFDANDTEEYADVDMLREKETQDARAVEGTFDLTGKRVAAGQRGIVIREGKIIWQ